MKKVIVGFFIAVIVIGAGYTVYQMNYGTQDYYTQVNQDGKKTTGKTKTGLVWSNYEYKQKSYAKNGDEKEMTFTATHNLKHEAYLKIEYNKNKGVMKWSEIQKKEIPEKALDNINN